MKSPSRCRRAAPALVGLALGLLVAAGAHAGAPQEQAECTRDLKRLCSGTLDVTRIVACLRPDRAKLVATCRPPAPSDEAPEERDAVRAGSFSG